MLFSRFWCFHKKTWRWFYGVLASMLLTSLVLAVASLPVVAQSASSVPGLQQVESNFSVAETGDRLVAVLQERRLSLLARINHAENAAAVGRELRPTELFIFGNPAVGTPLMQCNQSVGIDLPQKMLIWQDADEQVWLGYNEPAYLMTRHNLTDCERVVDRIRQVLEDVAQKVAQT